jgi:ribosomal protein S18 acetylase RimI-like enzyme
MSTVTEIACRARVRRGGDPDVDVVAAVLADAFTGYTWDTWTVAADRHTERVTALHALFLRRVVVPYGDLWLVEDEGEPVGAAAWMRPDRPVPAHVWGTLSSRFQELAGDRADAAGEAVRVCAPLRPEHPHFYLGTVGVRRDRQGQQLGTSLLQPGLEECDRIGAAAYVETSSTGNVRFYERAGFRVTGEVDVPGGGPHVWAMLRG